MKKVLTLLFLLSIVVASAQKANSMSFDEAMGQSKPVAVLIYAPWADNAEQIKQAYNTLGQEYGDRYNFTTVDITKEEAKGFNQKYTIYPNLPYVLFFKDRGRITRYLKQDCIMDTACFKERLDFFLN